MFFKIVKFIFTILLVAFSFYYTDKAVELVSKKDPIMKQIIEEANLKNVSSLDAKINGKYLIPGYNGFIINSKKSFAKMKKYGSYQENLMVFEETKPTISKEEYYDKYITSGNGIHQSVALIFPIFEKTYVGDVKQILEEENVTATFFIDGVYLEKNKNTVLDLASDFHEIEILSYNKKYEPVYFEASLDEMFALTNAKGKYCYAEYDQEEILTLCEKERLHTIIPSVIIKENPYNTVKGNIRNGSLISFYLTQKNIEELPMLIRYLKQRGYGMDTLDHLLSEARNIDK